MSQICEECGGVHEMENQNDPENDATFSKALKLTDDVIQKVSSDNASIADYIAIAFIESAVNNAADRLPLRDIADLLTDLAAQVRMDIDDEEDEDEG